MTDSNSKKAESQECVLPLIDRSLLFLLRHRRQEKGSLEPQQAPVQVCMGHEHTIFLCLIKNTKGSFKLNERENE